ncbi:alpha/beta fold hydrolase [Nonomuraea dietziae]|uniref:alpha/beta fold hydrolase n=1 Tax=Nonomuraea dietziae TaxID=65515 RepID=UPI00341CF9DA
MWPCSVLVAPGGLVQEPVRRYGRAHHTPGRLPRSQRAPASYVRETGNAAGPVLLLIHGGGVAGWMWERQIDHFAPGCRVLVPDLPGHGHSHDVAFTTSAAVVAELAAYLSELIIHEHAGHGLPLQYPEWFNARIEGWMRADRA